MNYIDIHCHLSFPDYDSDRAEILRRMKEEEVEAITVGTDLESSKRVVEIAEANEGIWATIGIHPHEVSKAAFDTLEFERLIRSLKIVAIGECGLDYFKIESEEEKIKQKELFESQIRFAINHDKPLMLHIRNAYDDSLVILENYKKEVGEKLRGNVHFFAGNIEIAKKFLDLGFTMSFTGVITFTHDYDEVIKYLPLESIMSETDAPFVAPVPYRGKRNEPLFVVEVVKKIAEIKGIETEETKKVLIENAKKMFGL